jgi:hypothetical protein
MLSAPLYGQHSGVDSAAPVTLSSMQDRYRPVLVFAPHTTSRFRRQMQLLAKGMRGLHERDVIVVPMMLQDDDRPWGVVFDGGDLGEMPRDKQAVARQRFRVPARQFTVILIGKDGGEKLRSHTPLSFEHLRDAIDSMPMRQEEMKKEGVGNRE